MIKNLVVCRITLALEFWGKLFLSQDFRLDPIHWKPVDFSGDFLRERQAVIVCFPYSLQNLSETVEK